MNAPDKIYLHPDIGGREFIRPWLKRAADSESVAYIRKNALIKWAEEMKDAWECCADTSYYQEFIDKINSM